MNIVAGEREKLSAQIIGDPFKTLGDYSVSLGKVNASNFRDYASADYLILLGSIRSRRMLAIIFYQGNYPNIIRLPLMLCLDRGGRRYAHHRAVSNRKSDKYRAYIFSFTLWRE